MDGFRAEVAVAMDALVYARTHNKDVSKIQHAWPRWRSDPYQDENGNTRYRFQVDGFRMAARAAGVSAVEFFSECDARSADVQDPTRYRESAQRFWDCLSSHRVDDAIGYAAYLRLLEFEGRAHLAKRYEELAAKGQSIPLSALAMAVRDAADETLNTASVAGPLASYTDAMLAIFGSPTDDRIPTPFPMFNDLLGGGWKPSALYVLLAPPKAGKTTVTAQFLDHAASLGWPCLYVGYEMTRSSLVTYAVSRRIQMDSRKIEARAFQNEAEARRVAEGLMDYMGAVGQNLEVWEADPKTSIADIGAWISRTKVVHPDKPPFVVVDYLQLSCTGDPDIDAHPSETKRVSAVAVGLKDLARKTGAAILALSAGTKETETQSKDSGEV